MSSSKHQIYDCDAIIALIPDYAFGLTTTDEARLVESNLNTCPEAAAQLADFRHLQEEMRADIPQVNPPAGLESRLMAAIATPQTPPRSIPAPAPVRRRLPLPWLAAAAAVIALIGTNIYWLGRVNSLTPKPDQSTSAQISVQGDSTFVLTRSSDLRWVRLPPSQQNTNASAVMLWNLESQIGLLYVRDLPKLSADRTYQLWLTKGEDRVSAGTFQVDEDGNGALLFHLTEGISRYTWARITEEPVNGSEWPSDQVVVVGEL
jgi:anti-sigma-K factor RskA